jgi:glycosyltransferase involved in cell wall biosynthesis
VVHSLDRDGFEIGRRRKEYGIAMAYDVESTHMSQLVSILGMSQETVGSLLSSGFLLTWRYLKTYLGSDRKLLKTADAVFVTSPGQKIGLERYYLYPEVKVYTVPYGIEIGDLSPREKSDELRCKLGFPADAQVVVILSDMSDFSEMRNILRAFERVVIKKPSSRLVVIGDGPRRKAIEFEMLSLALGSKVVFTGILPPMQIPDHIALADVFVNLSSRTTGFEPSILEAMAQKKIVIGSEVSPIATVVEDGKDGFLIRPADVEALSRLLLKVFSRKVDIETLSINARSKVLALFDTRKMVEQTLQAYNDTLLRLRMFRNPS